MDRELKKTEINNVAPIKKMLPRQKGLITNFPENRLWIYKYAVAVFGCKSLYIARVAYKRNGDILDRHHALMTLDDNVDYSAFWRLFAEIEREYER